MTRRNLIIIHRGPEYQQDFEDIATGVRRLDPDISIHICDIATAPLPDAVWELPTLTVAVTPSFRQEIKRGTILRNQPISKTAQYEQMQECGIPTPSQKLFKFGMKLDPIIFGAHVILKPNGTKFQSKGHGVNVFRRAFLEGLRPKDFHPLHPIHFDSAGYLVQRFTYTGPFAATHRVTTFLGEVLFCAKYVSNTPSPDLSSDDATIINGNFTQKGDRTITFESQDDILAIAKKTAQWQSS